MRQDEVQGAVVKLLSVSKEILEFLIFQCLLSIFGMVLAHLMLEDGKGLLIETVVEVVVEFGSWLIPRLKQIGLIEIEEIDIGNM